LPHCIVECSAGCLKHCDAVSLLNRVQDSVIRSGLFAPQSVRCRLLSYEKDNYLLPAVSDFLHITIRLLPGRSQQQKRDLSSGIIDDLSTLGWRSVSISCECVDLEDESYSQLSV